jgi:ACS family tartrate transporter-like MFS transporter
LKELFNKTLSRGNFSFGEASMAEAAGDKRRWDDRLTGWFWLGRPAADSVGERARRRVWVHLVPILFSLYILAYVDRSNVAVAQFGMRRPAAEHGLGFGEDVIGFGSGLFFWLYWVLEIPSTVSVHRRGARWVFCRILVLWGCCAVLMGFMGMPLLASLFGWLPKLPEGSSGSWFGAFAHHWNALGSNAESQFYFLRLALGFFEGGFFPTVVMYLSIWFKAEHRAKAMASFMAAMPLAIALGAPASQWISDHVHWGGLAGWRWIFILEGVAPILAGVGVLFCLPDRPLTAEWMPEEERDWLLAELETEHRDRAGREAGAWRWHLGLVALLTVVYFCQNVFIYGILFFMPSIVKSIAGTSETLSTWLAALVFLMAFLGMQINGWHSDRKHERFWHVAVPMCIVGTGLLVVSHFYQSPYLAAFVLIAVVGSCLYAHLPAFWPIPTIFLGSIAAASAIGFINMVGNLGGSLGPTIIGDAARNKDFATGLWRIAAFPLIGATVTLVVGYMRRARRRDE